MRTDPELEREVVMLFRRAGLPVPEERLDLIVQAYVDYRALAALLHQPMHYRDEPAGLYRPAAGSNSSEN